ncbi:hypothetical protein [Actinomadura sp. 3N407]
MATTVHWIRRGFRRMRGSAVSSWYVGCVVGAAAAFRQKALPL